AAARCHGLPARVPGTGGHDDDEPRRLTYLTYLPMWAVRRRASPYYAGPMLTELSNQFADAVAAAAPSVVQVQGRRRPASGLVYSASGVVTTMRAGRRQDGVRVRTHAGDTLEATLAGWDPATSLAVLK